MRENHPTLKSSSVIYATMSARQKLLDAEVNDDVVIVLAYVTIPTGKKQKMQDRSGGSMGSASSLS